MKEHLIYEYATKEGLFVLSSDGSEIGTITGEDEEGMWDCGVESCRGTNYIVKWTNDDSTNYVCSRGLKWVTENVAQIQ